MCPGDCVGTMPWSEGGSRQPRVLWLLWEGPGAAAPCPAGCREPAAAPGDTGGTDHSPGDKLFPQGQIIPAQSPGSTEEPLRGCLAGKAEAPALYLGREQGLVGSEGLLRVGEHTAEDLEQFTPCVNTHFGCLLQVLQVLYLYPRSSGIC